MRRVQSGGNTALSFGKNRAKLSSSEQKKVGLSGFPNAILGPFGVFRE